MQADVKDCNSHARTITLRRKFFLRSAQFFVSHNDLVIFLCTGKPDWAVYRNVESKDSFGMVHSERQFVTLP